jgi:uncharacterized protein involved in outer membrane biogenesis
MDQTRPDTDASTNRLATFATNPWLLSAAAALMVYALAGFSFIPYWVQHYAPRLAADRLHRRASVGEAQFNPFLFAFEVKDFAFSEADGSPILGLKRLFADFELESLVRRAWTFAELRLESPSLSLVMDPQGNLNLTRIAASPPRAEETPPPADRPPSRVLLRHAALTGGSVDFTDHTGGTTAAATIEPINLEFDEISTLPDRQGIYRVTATLAGGGTLEWRGGLSLNPVASSGEVRLADFNLATPWDFFRDRLNLAQPTGAIGIEARYRFSRDRDKTELTVRDLAALVKNLRLAGPGAADPLLTLDEIALAQGQFDWAGRTVKVPSLAVRNGQVNVSVDPQGEIDWQKLAKPAAAPNGAPPSPPEPQAPWRLAVEHLKIADIDIRYADASRKSPLVATIGRFGLDLEAEAELGAGPPKARLANLAAHSNRIALAEREGANPFLTWNALAVEGGQLDLGKREAVIQRAALTEGGTALIRNADGTLYPLALFTAGTPASGQPAAGTQGSEGGTPWRFALHEFALRGFGLTLADRSFSPEIAYALDDIHVTLKNLDNDGQTPVAFDTGFKVKQGGTLEASGTASPRGDTAEAKIQIDRIDLKPMQPLVARFSALKLEGADTSADLQVDFKRGTTRPSVKAAGGLQVNGLRLDEAKGGKRFLSWKTLAVKGIDFSLEPDRLAVKEVQITEPGANIEIYRNRTTNIAAVFRTKTPASRPKTPPAKAGTPKRKAEKPFPVAVERVRVDDGTVDFSDMSLVIPFATRIRDFDGVATGISTAAAGRAGLKFEGRVDPYGQATVDGTLSPLQLKTYSDIEVVFRNVAMTSLSPYSATFAGRKIRSGKLDLDLDYRVENHSLRSNSKIVLDQFALGERVESPSAVSLPLDLAVALLTDSEGKINASVPVEGNVDDPKFHYGKLLWDAIVTLVKKAVAAPFNALASVFGGPQENVDAVLFEPGRETIPPPEREKLHKVAEALAQRPQLELTVHGRFDPRLDGEALRSLQVRRALAQKQEVALKPGEDPGPVAFDSAKTQRALEALAVERGGRGALDALQADYEKASGRKPERVGALTAFLGWGSEDRDFYEKLFRHLVDTAPLPETELRTLADQRGKAVVAELTSQSLGPARVATGDIEAVPEGDGDNVPTRLELGAHGD